MAQLVEHNLAKVGVAGSSPVVRSKRNSPTTKVAGLFSYPLHGLEPERERALSKRGAFVASWRGRRQATEAGADLRSKCADAPLSAPTMLRGSNEPRFLLTLREPRAPHLAPQSSVAYIKYASLLFRGNLGHPEPARCRGRGSRSSILFTNWSIRPRRLEPERERALSKRGAFVVSWRGRRQAAEAGADTRTPRCPLQLSYAVLTNRVFC